MKLDYLYKNWPKIGGVCAPFLLLLLFVNSKAVIGSYEWFFWLSLPLYMLHQVEEYVYPGGFVQELNKILGKGDASKEILTDQAAFIVNVGFIWILTPVLVILGAASIIFPIINMTLVAVNGFIHVGASIRFKRYNPGLVASLLFNVPIGLYALIGLGLTASATSLELTVGIILGAILHLMLFVFLGIKAKKAPQKASEIKTI